MITIALVREDKESLYLQYPIMPSDISQWSTENVMPYINSSPVKPKLVDCHATGAGEIAHFLRGDPSPQIIADWPDDIRCFCEALIVGPGKMVGVPNLIFQVIRVDAYENGIAEGFIRHNAWYDAMSLRNIFLKDITHHDNKI